MAVLPLLTDDAFRVEDPYLSRALTLALRGRGRTAPNPAVGCVIVHADRIVGEGFHPRAGEPHAEVFALRDAGEAARGADAYVTLEPCAHHGRTPPCTEALVAAGVKRVVIGMRDPDPQASGGLERLGAAGIRVELAADPEPFAAVNAGWLKRLATGLPLVTVKVGASLDGRIALEPGARASMTGPAGARVTARLRDRADAVIVSAATVVSDDPELTARDADGQRAEHQPTRVVLVRDTLPPADCRLFTDGYAPTLILAPGERAEALRRFVREGVSLAPYDGDEGLRGAWRALGAHGFNDVLVEAGPRLFGTIVRENLADALVLVTAGGVGGEGAPAMAGGTFSNAEDSLGRLYEPVESGIIGDVVVSVWERSPVRSGV